MIFVDAGAFIARYRPSDQHHRAAMRGWNERRARQDPLVTRQLVLFEASKLPGAMFGNRFAADRFEEWLSSTRLQTIRTTPEVDLQAIALWRKFADQAISGVDCVSFVLMRRLRIKRAFAFDKHFAIAGFELWPPAGK
ncbi:MAG TPA: PIN domain-containing protein [Tepidisphaeraceae bacterium]